MLKPPDPDTDKPFPTALSEAAVRDFAVQTRSTIEVAHFSYFFF